MSHQRQCAAPNCNTNPRTLIRLFCATLFATTIWAQAQTLTVLHEFTGNGDGARPGGMTKDRAGNLYGSTAYGGDFSCNGGDGGPPGCGVLFRLKKEGTGWVLNPLYTFPGSLQGELSNYPGGLAIRSQRRLLRHQLSRRERPRNLWRWQHFQRYSCSRRPTVGPRSMVLQPHLRVYGEFRRRKSYRDSPAPFRPGRKYLWNHRIWRRF